MKNPKRFAPCAAYKINGEMQYTSSAPDGQRKASASWHDDRIEEIRSIFIGAQHQFKFKNHQEEIIKSILSGNDTFAILPTGSGKSLCFQAPSIFFPGLTLVITPLTALMENQVDQFNQNAYPLYHPYGRSYYEDIRFKAIYPGMVIARDVNGRCRPVPLLSPQAIFSEILHPAGNSGNGGNRRQIQYKLLYVSPERLRNPKFLRALQEAEGQGLEINHVVIDEVHCMSQWGFEFRESYLHIASFISRRPIRPVISAFTATATPKDIREIKKILRFPMDEKTYTAQKYREIFHVEQRENLSFQVIQCDDRQNGTVPLPTRQDALMGILEENVSKVCIIYRTTTTGVDELYSLLQTNELLKDRVVKYHAKMPKDEKSWSKDLFLHSHEKSAGCLGETDALQTRGNIMIATKAFGMGINKRDISMIIHYDLPRSLEDYYQEAGRAGRDISRVPEAKCILLYSAGPLCVKGTLQYTIRWVTSETALSSAVRRPISSQFSDDMKRNIYFWSCYRLCYVMAYCNTVLKHPDAAHSFILQYLGGKFSLEQAARDFDAFYDYASRQILMPPDERKIFVAERLFRGTEAVSFLRPQFGQTDSKTDRYQEELRQLVDDVNELHINNTYFATLLRNKPDSYQLSKPCVLPAGRLQLDQLPIYVGTHELVEGRPCATNKAEFTLCGSEKLSYFDMCVLDAIYSIEITQRETVYVQTVWEVLTGRNPQFSSQEKLSFRAAVQKSIDKMRAMSVSISDSRCGFRATEECFLPLTDKPAGEKGYFYPSLPPLFRYAEAMNGEIIRVPVLFFNAARIRTAPSLFCPSVDNAVLFHYLLHRTSISSLRRRGKFILFSTIKEVTAVHEDSCLLNQKVLAILDYFRWLGSLDRYYTYILEYPFRLTDKTGENCRVITDTAYFQVQDLHARDADLCAPPDFTMAWFSRYHEYPVAGRHPAQTGARLSDALRQDWKLSADTADGLAHVPLGRMDGVVLQYT